MGRDEMEMKRDERAATVDDPCMIAPDCFDQDLRWCSARLLLNAVDCSTGPRSDLINFDTTRLDAPQAGDVDGGRGGRGHNHRKGV